MPFALLIALITDAIACIIAAPRSLTLKGVMLGSWMQQPPEQRKADIALAQRLAHEPGALFEVAERYLPSRIADAVTHVSRAGRAGIVVIDFSKD